ncbi:MAG: ATP-dependent Clp protease ATP-binding subunit [Spirochaetales bacterium]|jgi:ATP-dependent Clp protease ATP-binding subunit ClpA|nr:ATP-dependent Clp protease ATP-binding subunit [Spirochaetales bacterium]
MKIDSLVREALNAAYCHAQAAGHEYLTPEHILNACLELDLGVKILQFCGVHLRSLARDLDRFFEEKLPVVPHAQPKESSGYREVLNSALLRNQASAKAALDLGDILVSLFEQKTSAGSFFLEKAGLSRLSLLQAVSHGGFFNGAPALSGEEPGQGYGDDFSAPDSSEPFAEEPGPEGNFLERYTRELCGLAREGKIPSPLGRQDLVDRIFLVLLRKLKNNPVLVGDPGVGKTSLIHALAYRVIAGEVPRRFLNCRIFSLDMGLLMAGAKYRGDFEERMKGVLGALEELQNSSGGEVLLFIDEIHSIIGAGAASTGSLDAASLLKPALSTGRLRCLGATTFDEFKKLFEKDRALARRFARIEVPEPGEEETLTILRGVAAGMETYHQVAYEEEALKQAAALSREYINDRFLPDKAIDVIDEAAAQAVFDKAPSPARITAGEINRVVARIARIPEKSVGEGETEKLARLGEELRKRIFGQDEAVDAVVRAIKRSRAGLAPPEKPVANFLFVGDTGVGKTELVRQLADILSLPLLRFDMSEYQDKYTASRLVGAPPGYVGYDEGGQLTDAVRRTPHAVLLLDEIEKAHRNIYDMLLQITDYATLTDSQGRKADFRNIILVMTSNAGSREKGKSAIGFGERDLSSLAFNSEIERIFAPEFRNRLDAIVSFKPLTREHILLIVDKEIALFNQRLKPKKAELFLEGDCREFLADLGYSREFGARNIARIVREKVSDYFVDQILFGPLAGGGRVRGYLKDGEMAFEILESGE